MVIQRWDPVRDILRLQEKVNLLFDDVLARSGEPPDAGSLGGTAWKPPVDIVDHEDGYHLRADLPGVAPSDVQLEVQEDVLLLRGERRLDASVPREAYMRNERPHGRFVLQVSLPPSVDRQGIQAAHRDGVLEILLPKRKEENAGKFRVEVK